MRSSLGCVPTTADNPEILSQVWPLSITAVNLMSGFRKTGIHPLNPGCIKDRELAPSKGIVNTSVVEGAKDTLDSSTSTANSVETHAPMSGPGSIDTSTSPDSALSHAMDSLFIKPELKRTARWHKPVYNHTAVCITDISFLEYFKKKEVKMHLNQKI